MSEPVDSEGMALARTSDDSLRQIISFLTGEDVVRLLTTGSKSFIARVAHNTTRLLWDFSLPSYFPSCSFEFGNLRSLIIKTGHPHVFVSLHGRHILPLEPMVSLETLDLAFPTSHLVFAPALWPGGLDLASSFPRLTYLSVRSASNCPCPDGWAKTLPTTLRSLTIGTRQDFTSYINASSFEDLPTGLQHLEFGYYCNVGPEEMNLLRFPNLRVLRIYSTRSWGALKSLPASLEELQIRCWDEDLPSETFPLSKFPPKIRTLTLVGAQLELDFDSMAPPTLEILHLELDRDLTLEELENFFHTKRLLALQEIYCLTPESLKMLPSLTELQLLGSIPTTHDALEILPRKLERFLLRDHMRTSPSVSFKYLPPTLKDFFGHIVVPEDISDLPKSITTLSLRLSSRISSLKIPTAVWRKLPSKLTQLSVQWSLFESEECLHCLPAKLQELTLLMEPSDNMIERITFSKSLQKYLEKLFITLGDPSQLPHMRMTESLFPKLNEFSRLSSLFISCKVLINSSTLAFLPKTLLELSLKCVEFENFGLPRNQTLENADWKEGALSRLPEGLETLNLTHWEESPDSIDLKLFSHLPPRLVVLNLTTRKIACKNPKAFVSSLPRRISELRYAFTRRGDDGLLENDYTIETAFGEAVAEYYSDSFGDEPRSVP